MEYNDFKKVIISLEEIDTNTNKLRKLGVDLIERDDKYYSIISTLIEAIYGKDGLDWVNWFCSYNNFGKEHLSAYYGETRVCYNIKSLWEHLEKKL